jgi:phosphoadenosine phosphosulfate reductase
MEREEAALRAIEDWFNLHPSAWVSFSGGKDSGACVDLARRVYPDVPVAFYNSGLEFPQNLEYIQRVANDWSLNLHEFHAKPSALAVLRESGQLEVGVAKVKKDELREATITRPVAEAVAKFGNRSIYGLRAEESFQRYVLLASRKGVVARHEKDGTLGEETLAPIWQWDGHEVRAYFANRKLEMNPLYAQQVALGVPERNARVGMLVDSDGINRGRWAIARQLAPDMARLVETHLPALAHFR